MLYLVWILVSCFFIGLSIDFKIGWWLLCPSVMSLLLAVATWICKGIEN